MAKCVGQSHSRRVSKLCIENLNHRHCGQWWKKPENLTPLLPLSWFFKGWRHAESEQGTHRLPCSLPSAGQSLCYGGDKLQLQYFLCPPSCLLVKGQPHVSSNVTEEVLFLPKSLNLSVSMSSEISRASAAQPVSSQQDSGTWPQPPCSSLGRISQGRDSDRGGRDPALSHGQVSFSCHASPGSLSTYLSWVY